MTIMRLRIYFFCVYCNTLSDTGDRQSCIEMRTIDLPPSRFRLFLEELLCQTSDISV
jgi:hypothetical protein